MDIFAIPAEPDVFGNVVLKAMASGVPVVAMTSGRQRAFIDGIRSLVKNRGRREMMGSAARARATERLSWDRTFIDVCNAYDAAIAAAEADDRARAVLLPA